MTARLSIIMPVLGEADRINAALARAAEAAGNVPHEIIVVDGDPAGATRAAVTAPAVKKITARPGRGPQMNAGAAVSGGDILLFLHADTCLPEGAAEWILAVCGQEQIAGGAFALGIDSPRPVFRWIERAVALRCRLTRIPYGDQAIFLKADVFRSLGGFGELPIMEDIDLMRRLKRQGHRVRLNGPSVRTAARRWESEGVAYATLRNLCLSTLFYLGVSPERLRRYYR